MGARPRAFEKPVKHEELDVLQIIYYSGTCHYEVAMFCVGWYIQDMDDVDIQETP